MKSQSLVFHTQDLGRQKLQFVIHESPGGAPLRKANVSYRALDLEPTTDADVTLYDEEFSSKRGTSNLVFRVAVDHDKERLTVRVVTETPNAVYAEAHFPFSMLDAESVDGAQNKEFTVRPPRGDVSGTWP